VNSLALVMKDCNSHERYWTVKQLYFVCQKCYN